MVGLNSTWRLAAHTYKTAEENEVSGHCILDNMHYLRWNPKSDPVYVEKVIWQCHEVHLKRVK
jgi:hypothetical protein